MVPATSQWICFELLALKLPDFEIKLNWFVFTKISVDNSGKFKFTVNAMTNLKLLFLPAILTKVSTIQFPEILLPIKSMSMTAILECHDYKLTGLCQESDSKCLQCKACSLDLYMFKLEKSYIF